MQSPKGSYYEPPPGDPDWKRYFQFYSKAGSDVPLFGDGNWVDAWPEANDAPPPDYSGKYTDNGMQRFFVDRHTSRSSLAEERHSPDNSGKYTDNGMQRFFVDRHQKAIDIGYADAQRSVACRCRY